MTILIPVFNDWAAAGDLLHSLDAALQSTGRSAHVVLIDDGSTETAPAPWAGCEYSAVDRVDILHLRRNLGHQRAITVGLYFAVNHLPESPVVVMDSDGEDRPDDVPRLLDAFEQDGGTRVYFAARTKRTESLWFRACYSLYRLVHRAVTGIPVRVGNFSVVPWRVAKQLLAVSEMWIHYAAAVVHAKVPHASLPLPRGRRSHGVSRMNFVSLLVHGLGAISVFGDVVSARILAATIGFLILAAIGLAAAGYTAHLGAPVSDAVLWGTAAMFLVAMQAVVVSILFVFGVIGGRKVATFLPQRDARFFILSLECVFARHGQDLIHRLGIEPFSNGSPLESVLGKSD